MAFHPADVAIHLQAMPETLHHSMRRWGHTYRQVSEETGLSTSLLHRLVNDPSYDPGLRTICKVFRHLDVWPA